METIKKCIPRSELPEEERERLRTYQREWRKKNAETYYKKQRERRASNPEHHRAWRNAWADKNREKLNTRAREYARKNPEAHAAKFLKYLNANRANRYENWGCQQAIKRGCVVADRDKMVELYQQAIDLTKSSGVKWSVDHIICMNLKGPHRPENAQVMPMDVNQIKSGNPFWICPDGKFKDWRDVPVKYWPKPFSDIYDSVVSHSQNEKPFYSMTA